MSVVSTNAVTVGLSGRTIGICYLVELLVAKPDWHAATVQTIFPRLADGGAVTLAVGIIGATIMPHAIFLHSSLTQDRTPALIGSQVVLSLVLPVPLVALIVFSRRKSLMGTFASSTAMTVAACAGAVVVLGLNGVLLVEAISALG